MRAIQIPIGSKCPDSIGEIGTRRSAIKRQKESGRHRECIYPVQIERLASLQVSIAGTGKKRGKMKEIDVFLQMLASLSHGCPEIGTRAVYRLTAALKLAAEQNGCSQGQLKATLQESDYRIRRLVDDLMELNWAR